MSCETPRAPSAGVKFAHQMKFCLIVFIAFIMGTIFAAEMTGYISDAPCGWNNARPGKEAKECVQKS
jgi:hypothetical protein